MAVEIKKNQTERLSRRCRTLVRRLQSRGFASSLSRFRPKLSGIADRSNNPASYIMTGPKTGGRSQRLQQEFPKTNIRLIIGAEELSISPKMNNLCRMVKKQSTICW
jgi:hypothetical protein